MDPKGKRNSGCCSALLMMTAIDAFLMAQCHVMGGSITISGYHEDDTILLCTVIMKENCNYLDLKIARDNELHDKISSNALFHFEKMKHLTDDSNF